MLSYDWPTGRWVHVLCRTVAEVLRAVSQDVPPANEQLNFLSQRSISFGLCAPCEIRTRLNPAVVLCISTPGDERLAPLSMTCVLSLVSVVLLSQGDNESVRVVQRPASIATVSRTVYSRIHAQSTRESQTPARSRFVSVGPPLLALRVLH